MLEEKRKIGLVDCIRKSYFWKKIGRLDSWTVLKGAVAVRKENAGNEVKFLNQDHP